MPMSRLPLSDWLGSSTSPFLMTKVELVVRTHDGACRTRKGGRRGDRAGGNEKLASRPSLFPLAGRGLGYGGFFDGSLERRQGRLDRFFGQVAGDEHHAGAAVLARPLRQQHRRVKEVLHPVQYDGLVG